MKRTIGIDLDSTLNDLETQWILNVYNTEYNDTLTLEDMRCWDVEEYVKKECGKKVYDILLRPNFFFSLNPREYAQEVTKKLSEKYDLFIVTAYHPLTVVDKVKWVEKHYPHINSKNIIFCNAKGLINTDYLIDDGGHNILDYYNNGGENPIVFDKPWNRYLNSSFNRAKDWLQIGNMLQ